MCSLQTPPHTISTHIPVSMEHPNTKPAAQSFLGSVNCLNDNGTPTLPSHPIGTSSDHHYNQQPTRLAGCVPEECSAVQALTFRAEDLSEFIPLPEWGSGTPAVQRVTQHQKQYTTHTIDRLYTKHPLCIGTNIFDSSCFVVK